MKATLSSFFPALCLVLGLSSQAFAVAANDNFANATYYTGALQSVSSTDATKETGEPNHAPPGASLSSHSVWWKYTPLFSGMYQVDTASSSFDTVVSVYTGTAVSKLARIAFNDDASGSINTSLVKVFLSKGITYRIAVDGYGGTSGAVNLHVALARYNNTRTYQAYVAGGDAALDGGGIITFSVANSGAMSGKFLLGARAYPFTAGVDETGAFSASVVRTGLLPASLSGSLGGQSFTLSDGVPATCNGGTVTCIVKIGGQSAVAFAYPAAPGDPALAGYFPATAAYSATNPCVRAGRYPFTVPPPSGAGYAVATLMVGVTGICTGSGRLGDGTAFAFTAPLLDNHGGGNNGLGPGGDVVFNVPLYASKGRFSGEVAFNAANTPASITGNSFWLRPPPAAGAVFLPYGIGAFGSVYGSRYAAPVTGMRMDAAFNPTGAMAFNAVSAAYPGALESVTLSTANTFTYMAPNANLVKLTPNVTTGGLTGSFKFTGATALSPVNAILIHHPNMATKFYGYVPGTTAYGALTVGP